MEAQQIKDYLKEKHGITTKARKVNKFKDGSKIIYKLGKYAIVLSPDARKEELNKVDINNINDLMKFAEQKADNESENYIKRLGHNRESYKEYQKKWMAYIYSSCFDKEYINGHYKIEAWEITDRLKYDFMGLLQGYRTLERSA
jgi:flagellar motility protein MotE (MotC chaperone)